MRSYGYSFIYTVVLWYTMAQVVSQVRKAYFSKEERPVQKVRGSPGSYWVQSSRFKQLWYKVTLIPEKNICKCTCDAFKFSPNIACKHVLKVVSIEVGAIEV